ncbi:hypothetical protein [Weissella cibaria]|uniref:Uncharacterized protein n=1 Tax=Weissella cibaria TaxID=137591 RepID=A0A2S1KQ37_9LACO|nr:hypothetical protein [Weissella cibaria]AWF95122.1 hypothetical protein B6254_0712 [Weissella cibaria]
MTHAQLLEAQMVLGKTAVESMLELLQNDSVKAVEQKFGFFEGESKNAWKMKIEKVEDK